jgi:hypothetical protein
MLPVPKAGLVQRHPCRSTTATTMAASVTTTNSSRSPIANGRASSSAGCGVFAIAAKIPNGSKGRVKHVGAVADGIREFVEAVRRPDQSRSADKDAGKTSPDFRRFRFHDLRHLFAVEALRGGMDIYTLSKHLGYASVKTTEIHLDFLSPEEQDAARGGTAQKTAQSRRFEDAEVA